MTLIAPSGVWICGLCVDCKICHNVLEVAGRRIQYWSCSPDRCYRCGGCDPVAQEITSASRCKLCVGITRKTDKNVIACRLCAAPFHMDCQVSRATAKSSRLCIDCNSSATRVLIDHKVMEKFCDIVATNGNGVDVFEYVHLYGAVDQLCRESWRVEFLLLIRDAMRIIPTALDDVRFLQVRSQTTPASRTLLGRCNRFLVACRRNHFNTKGMVGLSEAAVFSIARMAASFLEVYCHIASKRIENCTKAHSCCRDLQVPVDSNGVVEEEKWDLNVSRMAQRPVKDSSEVESIVTFPDSHLQSAPAMGNTTSRDFPSFPKVTPLCGWKSKEGRREWYDPRRCALCGICGDDDAGVEEQNPSNEDLCRLGRLLPVAEGSWVHAFCAMWSSEVFESPSDGKLHNVEKAKGRGAQLKCFGCGLNGATVGCCKSNCPRNYHLICALRCGAVFTANQRVFCTEHAVDQEEVLQQVCAEPMKALLVHSGRASDEVSAPPRTINCMRFGALTVHCLGRIETRYDGFHSEKYITPPGYVSTRIYWSWKTPRNRTLYQMRVEKTKACTPHYVIVAGDDPENAIVAPSVAIAFAQLQDRVVGINSSCYSSDVASHAPSFRRSRKASYGLTGPQFFGFGINDIRRKIECLPDIEAVVAQLTPRSPKYRFCFHQPTVDTILDLQRRRAAMKAERALENSSGSARTEGSQAVVQSGGSGRITRALVRSAEDFGADQPAESKTSGNSAQEVGLAIQTKYKKMKAIPIGERLVARRSHIHGWGLFTKIDVMKHDPVVEYMGEVICRAIGDKREKDYEVSGEGSCYMFRLDLNRIVDATKIGSMARFMNHSCDPNAYARIIDVENEKASEKKIVVIANRNISAGEEITYGESSSATPDHLTPL